LLQAQCVAAVYASQNVKVTSILSAASYIGEVKVVMEAGYAISMGIMTGTTLQAGYKLSSTAKSARRAGIEISFLVSSPPPVEALVDRSKAFSIAIFVGNIAAAKASLGFDVSVPTSSDVASFGSAAVLAPTASPTASPTPLPTNTAADELMGITLDKWVFGLLAIVVLMCLLCCTHLYCTMSINSVQQTRSMEKKEQRKSTQSKRTSQLDVPYGKIEIGINETNRSAYV